MMKRLSLMLATLAWLVTGQVSPAWAYWMEGNTLVEDCLSDDATNRVACLSYIIGVADIISVISNLDVSGFAAVCFPPGAVTAGVTADQLRRVVVKYLKAHPEETHEPAVLLVTVALREAFPCQA